MTSVIPALFVTEGSVTMLTENGYHAATGLLLYTDVTVNGTKQRVSAVTYDNIGRIDSVARGAASGSGGTVAYTYNLHGQTTSISGPGFSQTLHYVDGPGTKLYNGSVSAMSWTMGPDATQRGYKYTYNSYNWLTAAEYGEGTSLTANRDRYTEKTPEFMRNGGIRRLQRHGLKADGNYGKIDNLHIYYTGNRITGVLEDADPVTTNGSMDYAGTTGREKAVEYNEWGAMTKDEARGITSITYDRLGNPKRVDFSSPNGSYASYVYSATGEKLKATHYTNLQLHGGIEAANYLTDSEGTGDNDENDGNIDNDDDTFIIDPGDILIRGMIRLEYHGPVIYREGRVNMVRFPGGYATVKGSTVTFHYYTQDYLGNNRAVVNGSTGEIEQTVAYYPYGTVIADLGISTSNQPFKFGGKELTTQNGLNEYDFGARQYYPAVPGFTSVDPLCEKDYPLSPYLYCRNNPVNGFDLDGQEVRGVSKNDAKLAVEDFKAMFPGEEFDKFRKLIVQSGKKHNGKSLASISSSDLEEAFTGVSLNEDQTALVKMVVNTINSKDIHMVEYINSVGNLSKTSEKIIVPIFEKGGLPVTSILEANNGFPVAFIKAQGGGGVTMPTQNGSHSIIFKSTETSFHPNGRAVTTGHEILGHGRSLALGRGSENQHIDAIQTENLILRVMNINYINTGKDHIPNGYFPQHSKIPSFR